MSELEICKDCQWNEYPYCNSVIDRDGSLGRIDNLDPNNFLCGMKFHEQFDYTLVKSKEEILEERIQELESRIAELEK